MTLTIVPELFDKKYSYFALDIREPYEKTKGLIGNIIGENNFDELFRQIFNQLSHNMNHFMESVLNLPNYSFMQGVDPSSFDEDKHARVKEAIVEVSFRIYMSVREQGLFYGNDSSTSFPFHLEHITKGTAFLLIDNHVVKAIDRIRIEASGDTL